MTDLLARLTSTGHIKSSLHMTAEKLEALEHLVGLPGRTLTLTRRKGEDLPKGWQQLWEMQEAGWVDHGAMRRDDAKGVVEYDFTMTDAGYQKWLNQRGVEVPPPPPTQKPAKRRHRGPAAKTGKPGL